MLEFGVTNIVERKLTRHELKFAEQAAAVQAGGIAKIAHIVTREGRRKRKLYHRSDRKAREKA